MELLLLFAVFAALIVVRVPVAVALGLAALAGMATKGLNPVNLVSQSYSGLNSFTLLAVPFFLMVGLLVSTTSLGERLLDLSDLLVGWLRGALGHVNVVVSMLFGGISGSATADTSSIGAVLIPMMRKRGYSAEYSAAITAASSTIGLIIPPSILLIVYAAFANTSVGALFLAGFVPGVACGLGMMVINFVHSRRHGIEKRRDRQLRGDLDTGGPGPAASGRTDRGANSAESTSPVAVLSTTSSDTSSETVAARSRPAWLTVARGVPALGVFVIIIGGITQGVFTATEAGVIALFYLIILTALFYRDIRLKDLLGAARGSLLLYVLPLFAVATAGAFGWVLALLGAPAVVRNLVSDLSLSPFTYLLVIIAVFTVAGTFLDGIPAIVIFAPLFQAGATGLGIHPVHLGIVVTLVLAMGLVTPPYGLCLLIASRLASVSTVAVTKQLIPFWLVQLTVVVVVAAWPDFALFLPRAVAPDVFN